ncbi:unnamed protein product [Adineta ricciae]|uniref:NAD(P)(+)--arginine ADP-ribosyltransferase n=2 Tax=Adineta ricciae TaxID=249248 RepID=A0A814J953_ADIRI|nr:unnamed protein product [Adineta ricciae]
MAVWQCRTDDNPWDLDAQHQEWTSYSSEENVSIEQAYMSRTAQKIFIRNGHYCIDIAKCIQYVEQYPDVQRPIRRLYGEHISMQIHQRRLFDNNDTYFHPFATNRNSDHLMIEEWKKHFAEKRPNYTKGDVVDAAIAGIRLEGYRLNKSTEASTICQAFQACRNSSKPHEIEKCAVHCYTRTEFLFKLVNEALREFDRRKYRDTLGPYCFLLRKYIYLRAHQGRSYRGILYRGAWLHPRMIGRYRKEMEKNHRDGLLMWLGFTSTSKKRQVADMFEGNTLFIIDMGPNPYYTSQGTDISDISMMPHEKEVLLPSGFEFTCTNIETIEGTDERKAGGERVDKPYRHFIVHLLARQVVSCGNDEESDDCAASSSIELSS